MAAICTNVKRNALLDFAESVRKEIEKLTLENAPQLRVTISLGVALAPEDGNAPDEILTTVDVELYRAKREGRNCVRGAG